MPNAPADRITRPFLVSGTKPLGPIVVSFVWTPVIWEPLRTTLVT